MPKRHKHAIPSAELFELLPLGWLIFTPEGKTLAANSTLIKFLRYPDKKTFLNVNTWELFVEPWVKDLAQSSLEAHKDIRGIETKLHGYVDEIIAAELNIHIVEDIRKGTLNLECAVRDLATQNRISQALQELNHLVATLLKNVRDGIIIYDREFRYQVWNSYMENLSGLSSAQVLGSTIQSLRPVWDDPYVEYLLRRVLNGATVSRKDILFDIPDTGKSGRYDVTYTPQVTADGKITGIVAFIRNSADYNRWEVEFEHIQASALKQRMHAEALGRMMLSTGVLQNLPSFLDLICKEAATFLDMDSVYLYLLEEGHLVCLASHGHLGEKFREQRIPLSDASHFCVKVCQEKRMLLFNDHNDDGIIIDEGLKTLYQARSILAIPLLATGKAIGTLTLTDGRPLRTFEGDDLEFILQLGNQAALAVENFRLFENLRDANKNISRAYDTTLAGWAKALELRDQETEGHTQRVTKLTLELAQKFGMKEDELTQIYRGAMLHDIGKMGIPDGILLKPGVLDEAEREIMRRHPTYAYEMLKTIDYLHPALDIPHYHHEKWDGTGYPHGLKREDIPLAARIFAIADVWDALTSKRPYHDAWDRGRAIDYIQAEAGKHFDPQVVDKFFEIVRPHIDQDQTGNL